MIKLRHESYLVKTAAGAVYQCTGKNLHGRQVSKPDPEPPSADMDISNKAQPPVHVLLPPPQQPVSNHATAATPQPISAATQCTMPSAQPLPPH